MMRLKTALLLACCLLLGACATNAAIREQFEKSVKGYNQMLRWQEVESAGITYMDPELREPFMKAAADMRKKEVTITDYRIISSEFLPDTESAVVTAEFDYYILPSNRIKTVVYRQQWHYKKHNSTKSWLLDSGLPQFE